MRKLKFFPHILVFLASLGWMSLIGFCFYRFFDSKPSKKVLITQSKYFSFGDPVYVEYGFFKGCLGRVIDFHLPNMYDIDAKCVSLDNKFTKQGIISVSDDGLLPASLED